jgi:hypothetical protein
MAKNRYPISSEKTIPTNQERSLLRKTSKKGKLNNSDNPIGRDTIGRAMQQKIMLASMNSPVKEELSRPHQ